MRTSNSGKGIITAVCVVSVQKPRFPAALQQNQQTRRRTVRYVVRVWGSGRMQYPLFRHKARGIASSARIKGDEAGGTTFKTYRENGASRAYSFAALRNIFSLPRETAILSSGGVRSV